MNNKEPEEGSKCPECANGVMFLPQVENCSCHRFPPCSQCTNNNLTCNKCGWEFEPRPPEIAYRRIYPFIVESYVKRPSVELGDGKRIFDFDYDSSSGSTMEYKGKCTSNVTTADILKYFGTGSFGHRDLMVSNGRFTLTKITD
jgi:hypothetical protein